MQNVSDHNRGNVIAVVQYGIESINLTNAMISRDADSEISYTDCYIFRTGWNKKKNYKNQCTLGKQNPPINNNLQTIYLPRR